MTIFSRQPGFTLIESVVTLVLLATMSVLGYQAVEVVLGANERSRQELADEMALQRVWQIIGNDYLHLRPRPYPDGLGGVEGAYESGNGEILVRFTRGGGPIMASNPTGLTRVSYTLTQDGELARHSRPVYLPLRDDEARRQVLLTGVSEVSFDHIAPDNYPAPLWPPIDMRPEQALRALPRMTYLSIEMADGTTTGRLFPGVEND